MKKLIQSLVVPATLTMILAGVGASRSNAQVFEVGARLQSDPITISGQSGGSKNTRDCGAIAQTPNQVVRVSDRLDYLRISVEGGGEPTLLVEGPSGRFCVLADELSGSSPEISGVWLPGTYSIYIGDRAGGQHRYTMYISQNKSL